MAWGVYVHIPFCTEKCDYCDFLSFPVDEYFQRIANYVDALCGEIKTNTCFPSGIDTVYIGGGTPTTLPLPLLCNILQALRTLPILSQAEITVEANPGTLSHEYLETLINCGANRLSLGLQSTHPHLLKAIGRGGFHPAYMDIFNENFRAARDAGFTNINIDLMFALPEQPITNWENTLAEVLHLSPEHISAYSLTPAEATPLWDNLQSGKLTLPDDDTDRDMYHIARKILEEAGYIHYEISNFAKPGFESRHNINCWKARPYQGYGLGAHSFDTICRWHNTEDIEEYITAFTNSNRALPIECNFLTDKETTTSLSSNGEKFSPFECSFSANKITTKKGIQHLSATDLMSEACILGLRLTEGICEKEFTDRYGRSPSELFKPQIQKLVSQNLLAHENNRIFLTEKGLDLANKVFEEFIYILPQKGR